MTAAEKLKELRGKKTQKDVATAIGVEQSTYSLYERGKRIPSDTVKRRISKYYGISVQELFYS